MNGFSTDECHNHLLSKINKMLGIDDLMFTSNNGDRYFGLSLPLVRHKLQEKPESKFRTGHSSTKGFYITLLNNFFFSFNTCKFIQCHFHSHASL